MDSRLRRMACLDGLIRTGLRIQGRVLGNGPSRWPAHSAHTKRIIRGKGVLVREAWELLARLGLVKTQGHTSMLFSDFVCH
jgi:hypothetical protein